METKYFKLAFELNENYRKYLNEEEVHFRANINSMSLISLNENKPELGIKCNISKYENIVSINSILEKDVSRIKSLGFPGRKTPEKELQAWIIKNSILNNNQLPFNKAIKLITSELSVFNLNGKKVVTDILGYDENRMQLYVIEIKTARLLKRLIEQVSEFEKAINEQPEFFIKLLFINGYKTPNNFLKSIKKLIVWPYTESSPKEEFRKQNIVEITYQGHYTFLNHSK